MRNNEVYLMAVNFLRATANCIEGSRPVPSLPRRVWFFSTVQFPFVTVHLTYTDTLWQVSQYGDC